VGNHVFTDISCGDASVLALKSDGSCWAWGWGTSYGQLGIGSYANRSSPVAVIGSHVFTKISAGRYHSLALKSDGSVWGWGFNSSGQLGDNTKTDKLSPVLVVGSHQFVEIASGQNHSYGLKSNGEVWAWGENSNGQLGDNTTIDKSSPVLVVGNHSFKAIAEGAYGVYTGPLYNDSGLRYYNGALAVAIGCQDLTASHKLRFRKGAVTVGLPLVDTGDGNASKIRIHDGAGVKALVKYT